jgi:hypothetical protein
LVDYEAVAALYLVGAPQRGTPVPVVEGSSARRLRDALEPIAMHAVWSARVNAALAGCGYDFLSGYVTGRAAPLGDVPSAVVSAAFGVFEPGFIDMMWSAGRPVLPLPELITMRDSAVSAGLAEVLAGEDVGRIIHVAEVLERATGAVHGAGRPLFSALRAQPRLSDPFGRLWRAADLVREHRGDGHLAAWAAGGWDPVMMSVLSEVWVGYRVGEYSGTRGWPPEELAAAVGRLEAGGLLAGGAVTAVGRSTREGIEAATDVSQAALLAAVGDELDLVTSCLADWSQRCIDAKQFPSDPLKRAAG